ncbi:MAG: DUF1080 domain-containing protein, partial [Ginsengibacter sp.]
MKKKLKRGINQIFFSVFMIVILLAMTKSEAKANHLTLQQSDTISIQGRWDITIDVDGKMTPSWLEVKHSGIKMLVGRFVGPGGSARPISRVNIKDGKMSFSIPPQWEAEPNDLKVEGTLEGDNLTGEMTFSNGKNYHWTGKRAPTLRRTKPP